MFHHQLVEIWLHTLWPLSQVFVCIGFQFCWVDFGLLDYIITVFSSLRKCQTVFPAAGVSACVTAIKPAPDAGTLSSMGTSVTALWWLMIILSGLGRLRPFALRLGNCLELAYWWRPELLLSPALSAFSLSSLSFLTDLSFVILHSRSLLYSLRFLPWPLSGILQLSFHCCSSCCHQGGDHHHCLCPIAALVLLSWLLASLPLALLMGKIKVGQGHEGRDI